MISDLGYGAYFFFGSILVAMGVWSWGFVPETKGLSLEEMDALFSKSVSREIWAHSRGRKWGRRGDEGRMSESGSGDLPRDSSVEKEREIGVEKVEEVKR